MKEWSVQAPWVIPGDGQIIADGILRGCGAVIEAIGPAGQVAPSENHRTLPDAAILPGLVNAHTHLELSHLRGLLPRCASMPRWLLALLRHRGSDQQQLEAVAAGAREAVATGTTTLADISHDGSSWRVLRDFPLRKLCLSEVLGTGPREEMALARLQASLEGTPPPDDLLRFGITPHAPYSTSENLYRRAIALARERGLPICTHLAETKGERQLLLRGRGTFLNFLRTLGLADDSFAACRCTPMEFAHRVGLLGKRGDSTFPPVFLAHVNYIDDEELELLAASDASVVYCPGSSAFFGRRDHRYAEMLARGINVALGTDSLASNSSLDMLAEMRRLKRQGRVDSHTILRMATLHGARAMGWDDQIGTLQPGKFADFIVVELPSTNSTNRDRPHLAGPKAKTNRVCPYLEGVLETVLTQSCKVVETIIGGRTVWDSFSDHSLPPNRNGA